MQRMFGDQAAAAPPHSLESLHSGLHDHATPLAKPGACYAAPGSSSGSTRPNERAVVDINDAACGFSSP